MAITIAITSGTGYFGSVYTQTGGGAGEWRADGVAIPGETGATYTMTAEVEGKVLTYWTASEESNALELWVPSDLPNLLAWFDPAAETTLTKSGGLVSEWRVRGGSLSTLKFQQATGANQPSWSATGRNGKPAILSAGDSRSMQLDSIAGLPGLATTSVVAALAYISPAVTGYRALFSYGPTAGAGNRTLGKHSGDAVGHFGSSTGNDSVSTTPWVGLDRMVIDTVTSANGEYVIDGQTTVFKTNAYSTPAGGVGKLFEWSTGSNFWTGSIQELLIFSATLTNAQRQLLEGYMAAKWGVQASLPTDHPYKGQFLVPGKTQIYVESGSGYFGSVYRRMGSEAGQWYADETPIAGQTGATYTMQSANEGKKITFRPTAGGKSNAIRMWTPATALASVIGDFDVSLASSIVEAAGVVDSITSRNTPWQLTQTVAADKPTYNATGRNGLPVISGDGVSDHFNIVLNAGAALPVGTTPSVVLAMAHYANQTGDNWRTLMTWGTGASATNAGRNLHKSSGEFVASGGSAAEDCITAVSWPNNDRLVVFEYTSTGKRIFVDGNNTPTVKSLALNTAAPTIQRVMRGTTDYWRGGFQEILVLNAVLTDADRWKAEAYLAHKWGKRESLPTTHPYRVNAPTNGFPVNIAATGLLPTAEVLAETNGDAALTISVTSGTGYFGSVYTLTPVAIGQWYAGTTPIPGATGPTYTMESKYEGREIQFRAANGRRSNKLHFFTPDMIPSLLGWWDASRSDLITTVSNAVSLWTSRHTGAYTLSQATAANRPGYSLTGRNGKPALTADGVDDFLTFDQPTSVLPIGTSPSVIAGIGYYANLTPGTWKSLIAWGTSITTRGVHKNDLENVAMGGGAAGRDLITTVNWTNKDKIFVGTDLSTGKLMNVDGGAQVSKPNSNTTPNRSAPYVFRDNTATNYWQGSLQDFMIFNAALSDFDRQKVEGYLAAKWGTRALLPADHPYKTLTPPPAGVAIAGVGLLPTAEIQVQKNNKANLALNGLLPTMAAIADTAPVGPIVISASGRGYAGSVYSRDSYAAGKWYVGGVPISPEETGMTLTMKAEWEGRGIQFRALNGVHSNTIDLFAPNEVGGMVAWFDAYASSTVTHVAGVVSQVSSRWGAWTLTQATEANKPAYSATGHNSKPAISADGTNDYFVINPTGAGLPDNNEDCNIVAFGFSDNAVSAYRMLIKWGSVSTARRGIARSNLGMVSLIGGTAQTNNETVIDWEEDRIVIGEYQSIGSVVHVDGGTPKINANVYNSANQADAYVFRDATVYWQGGFQEIMIFDKRLSDADRQKIEGYLAAKWGYANLPIDHPYKFSNPPPNQAAQLPGHGFLPTAAISVHVPILGTMELNGYLPTMSSVAAQPNAAEIEANGLLPTMEATGKQQSRVWIETDGLLPTMEAEATTRNPITVELQGFLPTTEIVAEFPVSAIIDAWGYLPVSEIGGEAVYEVEIEANGLLPTAEIAAELFEYEATIDLTGLLPTAEALVAPLPKATLELENFLPFTQIEVVYPTRVMADLTGYLPTAQLVGGTVYSADIFAMGYLPTAEIAAEVFKNEATIEAWGYLAVSEIGAGGLYEVEIDANGLLPTMEATGEVAERIEGTIIVGGLLPTMAAELHTRHTATITGVGLLPTMAALVSPAPIQVTLDLTGYLPNSSIYGGGAGEDERPEANSPSIGTGGMTLTVGGGPVLSHGNSIRIG